MEQEKRGERGRKSQALFAWKKKKEGYGASEILFHPPPPFLDSFLGKKRKNNIRETVKEHFFWGFKNLLFPGGGEEGMIPTAPLLSFFSFIFRNYKFGGRGEKRRAIEKDISLAPPFFRKTLIWFPEIGHAKRKERKGGGGGIKPKSPFSSAPTAMNQYFVTSASNSRKYFLTFFFLGEINVHPIAQFCFFWAGPTFKKKEG